MSSDSLAYWKGRRVFVTGDMGFKGSWLCSLLSALGAESVGYGHDVRAALLYRELSIRGHRHVDGDINDLQTLTRALAESGAEVLFHLAAQPLVLASYQDPVGTFDANVMGTVRVLQAARSVPHLKAVVIVTSDKVYRNNDLPRSYAESDALGGSDPYSASKAAAEIVTAAMVSSFFSAPDAPRVASVRAGNVVGGGDWADNRLLPDAARALGEGIPLVVRNPSSTRPWQHVLDPLLGYLLAAQALATARHPLPPAWNFGPDHTLTVGEVADLFVGAWGADARWRNDGPNGPQLKEAAVLALDSSLARRDLEWRPRWSSRQAVARTSAWYRDFASGTDAAILVARDLKDFLGND